MHNLLSVALDNDYSRIEAALAGWSGPPSLSVSVVLTTYNMRHLLEKTLCGLQQQTYPAHLFEVIVSDDGSSDGVEEIARQYAACFAHLTFLTQPDTGYRLATARNRGLQAAQGEVVVSLDGDVLPTPDLLKAHLAPFHVGERMATIGYLRYVDTSQVAPAQVLSDFESLSNLPDYGSRSNWGRATDRRLPEFANFKHHPAAYNCFHGGNVAFRREEALAIGLFDEEFNGNWGYEDLEFGYRLWKRGNFLVPVAAALGLHQEREFLTLEQRQTQRNLNFEKMAAKVPGFREYRQQIGR